MANTEILTELERFDALGILGEDASSVERRLALAVAASAAPSNDMGKMRDWASRFIGDWEVALRKELCNIEKGELKESYQKLANKVMANDGLASLAGVVLQAAKLINPAVAIPSLAVLMAVWVAKVGLNHWCSLSKS